MSQKLESPIIKEFIITYECVGKDDIRTITHDTFYSNIVFRKFIKQQKCLACGFECTFEDEIKMTEKRKLAGDTE